MRTLTAYVDGGSHGNPGPSGIGVLIHDARGETVRIAKWIGHQDNNVAEYVALLEALQHAVAAKAKALHVFSDSEIVVKQMNGAVRLPQPATLFAQLDLSQTGALARVLHRAHQPQRQP